MNIRLATINDLNKIYYIEKKVFNDYWSIDLIESELNDQEHSEVSVLEINNYSDTLILL